MTRFAHCGVFLRFSAVVLMLLGFSGPSQANLVMRFQECPQCPKMLVIHAGEFMMGSNKGDDDEDPMRVVKVEYPFVLAKTEVTVGEFRRFVEDTGYRTEAERDIEHDSEQGCTTLKTARGAEYTGTTWRDPGFDQGEDHPVVCVSWNDAKEYAKWLSERTGEEYRLPSEAQWEYAARAGTIRSRHWGDDPNRACRYANVADRRAYTEVWYPSIHECDDEMVYTAPVASYWPNQWGLNDMIGNVWEWVEDCYHSTYCGAPPTESAWVTHCEKEEDGEDGKAGEPLRVMRGGAWSTSLDYARSAARDTAPSTYRSDSVGFRLVRILSIPR
jgi:formylglycine-generating enzyme required for sulfatase activity